MRADVDVVAGHWQHGRDHKAVARPVLEHLISEQKAFASLGHDDQKRLGQRIVRRRRLHLGQQQSGNGGLQVCAGMHGDDPADLVQEFGVVAHTSQNHLRSGQSTQMSKKSRGLCNNKAALIYR